MTLQMKFLIFLPVLLSIRLTAQVPAGNSVETFLLLQKQDTLRINTAVASEAGALDRQKDILGANVFPTVTLSRNVFRKIIDINNRQNSLAMSTLEENQVLRTQDTLNNREIATLRSINTVQKAQIDACEKTNDVLNQSIAGLNLQLNETRQLARDNSKNDFGKRLTGILLGGGIGIGLGVILGVIVAK